jgi:hypothetical protein
MAVVTEESPVARNQHGGVRPGQSGRPKTVRDDISVKMDRSVAAKAQYLARLKGMTLAEFISETVRGPVEREFAKATREGAVD